VTKLLDDLQDEVASSGYKPDTPEYEMALRKAKVEQCISMRGLDVCSECPLFEFCALRAAHWFDRQYGNGS